MWSLSDFTLKDCHCPTRITEQRANRFLYIPLFHGYVFPDSEGIPRRTSGKPFVFVNCPWCGGSLDDRGEAGW